MEPDRKNGFQTSGAVYGSEIATTGFQKMFSARSEKKDGFVGYRTPVLQVADRNCGFGRLSDWRVSCREQMPPKTKIGETNNIGLCLHDLVRNSGGMRPSWWPQGITAIAKTINRQFPINAWMELAGTRQWSWPALVAESLDPGAFGAATHAAAAQSSTGKKVRARVGWRTNSTRAVR